MSRNKGQLAERQVMEWLTQQGLTPLASNVQCRLGELDLVMNQGNELVFVEVKYRQSSGYGGALAAITPSKQQKLRRAAAFYLQQQGWSDRPCRFDVVTVENGHIDWIQDAF